MLCLLDACGVSRSGRRTEERRRDKKLGEFWFCFCWRGREGREGEGKEEMREKVAHMCFVTVTAT